jgi:hypothetical protein
MAFWFQDHHLLAAGQEISIEYLLNGGGDQGAQVAMPVPFLAANEWLEVTGQGLFYDSSTRTFRYWATFKNKGNETASFQIRGGGLV